MTARLVAALCFAALCLLCYLSLVHWGDDRHPLAIDAAVIVTTPPPGEDPLAIPDPNALYAPCPLMPRNVPTVQRRTA